MGIIAKRLHEGDHGRAESPSPSTVGTDLLNYRKLRHIRENSNPHSRSRELY